MARESGLNTYILDTSYLLEIFAVPGFSEPNAVVEIRRRYSIGIDTGAVFYVPLPCIFELANHIADVREGLSRRTLALKLSETLAESIANQAPWIITPGIGIESLMPFFDAFANDFVSREIGLTDTFLIQEAVRIKKRQNWSTHKVHIWTRDRQVKTHEPDPETNPFV